MSVPDISPDEAKCRLALKIAADRNSDVYFFAGPIEWRTANEFRECVSESVTRPNALLFLTTFGGSGDAAFQMARCLQSKYDGGTVSVLIASFCKSAGTLLTLGANNVIMTDLAELGPLDVQIAKPDTLGDRVSGLTPSQSLTTLRKEAFLCFEKFFLDILSASGHGITTKTAALIAARITAGLYRPIYAQIDPMQLGEFQRAVQIAMEYGKRLNSWSKNLKDLSLSMLIGGYPSHEFVIDMTEARTLFHNVQGPTAEEQDLADLMSEGAIHAAGGKNAHIEYLGPGGAQLEDREGNGRVAPPAGERPTRTRSRSAGDGNGRRRRLPEEPKVE